MYSGFVFVGCGVQGRIECKIMNQGKRHLDSSNAIGLKGSAVDATKENLLLSPVV